MRIVDIRLDELIRRTVPLGMAGENLHTRVRFDCSALFAEYPSAAACLTVRPPRGDPYPDVVSRSGDLVCWDVTDSDLALSGTGQIQLAFTVDEVIAKSFIGQTYVGQSIIPSGGIPPPLDDWLVRAEAALARIPEYVPEILLNTTEYWRSRTGFIPARGALVVYTDRFRTKDGQDIPGLKIGDGDAYVPDLPFVGGDMDPALVRQLEEHLLDTAAHVSLAERTRWNSKLNCGVDGTTLILNRL